jgi:integrase
MPRKREGERPLRDKIQAYVRVKGQFLSKSFPATSTYDEREAWRAAQRQQGAAHVPARESFAADIVAYRQRRQAMPTIAQRLAHLELWAQALGRDRSRRSITDREIDTVLQQWLADGLGPATVRKRRTALQSFFVTMDGKGKVNPVKATHNPKPPKPMARGIDYLAVSRLLAAMPTYRSTKPGAPRELSLAKIRARIVAYTGLPPGILAQVVPDDVSFTHRTLHVPARQKGEGIEARILPLTEEGLAAFKDLHAANGYGPFACAALNLCVKRAAKKASISLPHFHLYDLRHSFLAQVYRTTGDEATVGRLGLHAAQSVVTKRYTMGAHAEVDTAAVAAFSAALATARQGALKPVSPVPHSVQKLRTKVAQTG